MKTTFSSKAVALLALMIIIFSSCDLLFTPHEPKYVIYNLGLNFQDASGNDLVNGIELEEWSAGMSMENALWGVINRDLYVLDIILSEPCKNWDNEIYNAPARPGFWPDVNRPKLLMQRHNGDCYLTSALGVPVNDCPEEKILTYKLKIPYVFGDEAIHELVTYWDIPKTKSSDFHYYAKCYRIEFEGNEIIPQPPMEKSGNYSATITLGSP